MLLKKPAAAMLLIVIICLIAAVAVSGQNYGGRGFGTDGECICPNCGYTEPHERGIPCSDCPKCGTQMIRQTVTPTPITQTPIPAQTPSPTPTSKTPGFEVIFAIAGLLAAVYILRRGD